MVNIGEPRCDYLALSAFNKARNIAYTYAKMDNTPQDSDPKKGSVVYLASDRYSTIDVRVSFDPLEKQIGQLKKMSLSYINPHGEERVSFERIPASSATIFFTSSAGQKTAALGVIDEEQGLARIKKFERSELQAIMEREYMPAPGSALHPRVLEKLHENGVKDDMLVKDGMELRNPAVDTLLQSKEFSRENDNEGCRIYATKGAFVYGTGQRALLGSDGAVKLITFVDKWIQFTDVDAAGQVTRNQVIRLP